MMLFLILVALMVVGIIGLIMCYKSYKYPEWLLAPNVIVVVIAVAAVLISLGIIVGEHVTKDAYVASNMQRYESLVYQYENNIYDNDNDLGKRELIVDIQTWNEDLAKRKILQDDFWVGIYISNIYDQFEFIKLEPKADTDKTTPETEVDDTVECTTAPGNTDDIQDTTIKEDITVPDETIVPTTTENIHTEVTDEPEHVVEPDELEMLACVIYQEAGGDAFCDDCRRRVADVVLNRIADPEFPSTMYAVLTEKGQYGKLYSTGIKWPSRHTKPEEKNAVARAYRIAEEVLNGKHSELYGKGYIWQASFKQSNDNVYCCGHYYGR